MITVIKSSLEAFCSDQTLRELLKQNAERVQRIIAEAWHLIHIYIRLAFEESRPDLISTQRWHKDWVLRFIFAVSRVDTKKGRPKAEVTEALFLKSVDHYLELRGKDNKLESRDGLSHVLNETATRMAAEINTNIREHFFQHQRRYLRLRDALSTEDAQQKQQQINTGKLGNDDSIPLNLQGKTVFDALKDTPELFLPVLWKYNQCFEKEAATRAAAKEEVAATDAMKPKTATNKATRVTKKKKEKMVTSAKKASKKKKRPAGKEVDASKKATGEVTDASTKRTATGEAMEASTKRKATGEAMEASTKRKATGEVRDASKKRTAAGEVMDASKKRNTTGEAMDASKKRNAAGEEIEASKKRNATGEAMEASRKATGEEMNASTNNAASVSKATTHNHQSNVKCHKVAILPLYMGFVPGACLHLSTDGLYGLLPKELKKQPAVSKWMETREKRQKEESEERKRTGKKLRPGCNTSPKALDEKDLLWKALFNVDDIVRPSRVKSGRIRFGHSITTDGISISLTILHMNNKPPTSASGGDDSKLDVIPKAAHHVFQDPQDEFHSKILGVDPGIDNIVVLTNGHIFLQYSLRQRIHESKHRVRNARQEKRRSKAVRKALEELSATDSRATSLKDFKAYLKARYKVQEILGPYYNHHSFRVDRWYNFRDRRSSEDRFVQLVKKTFGPDAVLGYGSWNGNGWCGRGKPPCPVSGFRRRLAKHFTVVTVPEAYTTKTCSFCLQRTALPDPDRRRETKSGNTVPVRGIRRCQSEICGDRRWNRDENGSLNIRENLLYRLQHGKWDPKFVYKGEPQNTKARK